MKINKIAVSTIEAFCRILISAILLYNFNIEEYSWSIVIVLVVWCWLPYIKLLLNRENEN